MSLESEDQLLLERKSESQEKSKILYTREYLLSFSDLDICKKLPSGFDASILSETKCSDYGSSPPNRSEGSGSYSRGSSGKWDARSSGSSSRDGDPQSNREAFMQDSGRHFGTQSRRSWQHPEQDGLLGSGAFSRPSGYTGTSAPKGRLINQFQLNRTSEPYQPPRPYKALPFQRKDDKDSCNDETFGSTNYSSEDRAEEEQRRRASFELMRKEQQKALQEKQKQIPEYHKENLDADILALLENSADKKSKMNKNEKADDSSSLSQNDSSRPSTTQAPLSRPLVPPGFSNTALDKNLRVQSSSTTYFASEASFAGTVNNLPLGGTDNDHEKMNQSASCLDNSILKSGPISDLIVNDDAKLASPSSGLELVKLPAGAENVSCTTSGLQKVNKAWDEMIENDDSDKKEEKSEITHSLMQDSSLSILEKLLGSSLSKSSGSPPTSANQGFKTDEETWIPANSESSKFASWFLEEENKNVEGFSSKDLLSLIVNNEKVGSPASVVSSEKASEHIAPSVPFKVSDITEKLDGSPRTSLMARIPEQQHQGEQPDSSTVVLTCEDVEQYILADIEGKSSNLQHAVPGPWKTTDGKLEQQKSDIDDHASQHLLSLLQKGTKKDIVSVTSTGLDIGCFDKFSITDKDSSFNLGIAEKFDSCNSETGSISEKTLTLEALFGAAFMNELQSAQAPVSIQKVADGGINTAAISTSLRFPFPNLDASFFSSRSGDYQPNRSVHERDMVSLNHIQAKNAHCIPGPGKEHGNSLVKNSKLGDPGFVERGPKIHLPEEVSLITGSGSLDSVTSDSLPILNASRSEELLSERNVEHDTLFNAIPRDAERIRPSGLDGLPPFRSPHDLVGSDTFYHHLQGRTSQLPHIMNQARPLHLGLDHLTDRNQQMKLIGPEGIHHDPNRNFPENIVPHNTSNPASGPRIDPAAYHLMLQQMPQQMPVPANFPQQLSLPGLPRGVPLSHTIDHMQGYIPEMNNVHNILSHQQQPNNGSFGMGVPGSLTADGRGNHPEAFQRLIEMELRANGKQHHPAAPGHIPGIYGPEFDMSFRYR